jgi:sRNA-binding carbon storage regulator CsrA
VTTSASTPEEEDIVVGDGVEIKIVLTRENLQEGEK